MYLQYQTETEDCESVESPSACRLMQFSSSWGEIVSALALMALAIWFLVGAQSLSGSIGAIGPATFPTGIGALLLLAALAWFGTVLRQLLGRRPTERIEVRRPVAIVAAIVLIGVFPFAMPAFGYYPTMAVWLVPFAWAANVRRPLPLIGVVGGFLLFSKLVFEMLLGTPLPH
ncbi:tripartite tricarboxylate transporter TctB family protein [Marinobacterium aestuariivivens]|uniref:Tripartite tricarboxylate transporter TctB family protein n=1 Tax=Marinobacterium aestuariivivens TaxID=1698799 RepID=A0ABW2A9I3_9GAMM